MWFVAIVSIILLAVGLILLRSSQRDQARTGLPSGTVVYADTGTWERVAEPLRSRRHGIVGKPDYLVEIDEQGRKLTIPVEVKSRRKPATPYEGHILQLGAYCLLVEEYARTTALRSVALCRRHDPDPLHRRLALAGARDRRRHPTRTLSLGSVTRSSGHLSLSRMRLSNGLR